MYAMNISIDINSIEHHEVKLTAHEWARGSSVNVGKQWK